MLQTSVTFAWVGADPKVRVDETAVGSKISLPSEDSNVEPAKAGRNM